MCDSFFTSNHKLNQKIPFKLALIIGPTELEDFGHGLPKENLQTWADQSHKSLKCIGF